MVWHYAGVVGSLRLFYLLVLVFRDQIPRCVCIRVFLPMAYSTYGYTMLKADVRYQTHIAIHTHFFYSHKYEASSGKMSTGRYPGIFPRRYLPRRLESNSRLY